MADNELKMDTVRSYASGVMGRALNTTRDQHFIVDSSHGPGEAPNPVEVFLSGISSCAVHQAEIIAEEQHIPLKDVKVTIESARKLSNTANFHSINLRFELTGVDREQAGKLVEGYQAR